jgi:hypothetical protein
MSDQEASEMGAPVGWLLVGFVVVMFLTIGLAAFFYQQPRPDPICSHLEARCGDKPDPSAQGETAMLGERHSKKSELVRDSHVPGS